MGRQGRSVFFTLTPDYEGDWQRRAAKLFVPQEPERPLPGSWTISIFNTGLWAGSSISTTLLRMIQLRCLSLSVSEGLRVVIMLLGDVMDMTSKGYLGPIDLATITKVVDDYCAKRLIKDVREREYVAVRAFQVFQEGTVEADEIMDRLEGPSRAA